MSRTAKIQTEWEKQLKFFSDYLKLVSKHGYYLSNENDIPKVIKAITPGFDLTSLTPLIPIDPKPL